MVMAICAKLTHFGVLQQFWERWHEIYIWNTINYIWRNRIFITCLL